MIFPSANPWMFHRDEIDLLEEEMDEIYEQHDETLADSVSHMEDRILNEQITIEEQAEEELSLKIGPHDVLAHMCAREEMPVFLNEMPLTEFLHQHAKRGPLYETLFLWAKHVFAYARTHYFDCEPERAQFQAKLEHFRARRSKQGCNTSQFAALDTLDQAIHREDLFRLYVNVKMIPIKFVSAQEGCATDDVMAQEIAKKEAMLCLTYFERVLDSLQRLSFLADELARQFHQDGIVIKDRVRDVL